MKYCWISRVGSAVETPPRTPQRQLECGGAARPPKRSFFARGDEAIPQPSLTVVTPRGCNKGEVRTPTQCVSPEEEAAESDASSSESARAVASSSSPATSESVCATGTCACAGAATGTCACAGAEVGDRTRRRRNVLGALHECGPSSLLLQVVLRYCRGAELATLECCTRKFAAAEIDGLSVAEYAAWTRLRAAAAADAAVSRRRCAWRLHVLTERCAVRVLRRRASDELSSVRGAASLARACASRAFPTLGGQGARLSEVLSERDAARAGVRVEDGVFTAAPLSRQTDETHRIPPPTMVPASTSTVSSSSSSSSGPGSSPSRARVAASVADCDALGLVTRGLDDGLALGECVVSRVPASLAHTPLRADDCWVLRAVDGAPCWTRAAFRALTRAKAQLAASDEPTLELEFERAYVRVDLSPPLAATKAAVLATAKRSFGEVAPAALFATARLDDDDDYDYLDSDPDDEQPDSLDVDGLARRTAADRSALTCWTERDAAALVELGFKPKSRATLLLVVLPHEHAELPTFSQ